MTEVASSWTIAALTSFLLDDFLEKECTPFNEIENKFYKELGKYFSQKQIERINSPASGLKNIEIVAEHVIHFINLGYSVAQITDIASPNGGWRNLLAVKENHHKLTELHFSHQQITQIAAFHGGGKNIKYVIKYQDALNVLGNERACIIAASHGASIKIENLNSRYQNLKKTGLTDEQIKERLDQPVNYTVNKNPIEIYGHFSSNQNLKKGTNQQGDTINQPDVVSPFLSNK
ncbi:MAG: hypothetical protein QM652_09395 [Legionella sp.]